MAPRRIFTEEEKSLLAQLVRQYDKLECKKTNAMIVQAKIKQWQLLTEQYNANTNVTKRTFLQLRTLWKNLKVKAKKERDSERQSQMKTCGGQPDAERTSQVVEDTLETLPPKSFDPIKTELDDDDPPVVDPARVPKVIHIFKERNVQLCDVKEQRNDGEVLIQDHLPMPGSSKACEAVDIHRPASRVLSVQSDCVVPELQEFCIQEPSTYQDKKRVSEKKLQKACELDIELYKEKIKTEKKIQNYYDWKIRCAREEENKIKRELEMLEEKHKIDKELLRERYLLSSSPSSSPHIIPLQDIQTSPH